MKHQKQSTVIYEDNHLIAMNKTNGTLSQGDETGDYTLMDEVKRYIKWKYDKPGDVFLGSFHRLDRPASGVVIYAKTSKALSRMNQLMRDRKISKTYFALAQGRPQSTSGKLKHYLAKDHKKNISKAYHVSKKDRKESTLDYELLGYLDQISLFRINLGTGRSHQIRVQLSTLGHPIIGDKKYGSTKHYIKYCIGLHCYEMSFIHPVTKEPIRITAATPENHHWNVFLDLLEG